MEKDAIDLRLIKGATMIALTGEAWVIANTIEIIKEIKPCILYSSFFKMKFNYRELVYLVCLYQLKRTTNLWPNTTCFNRHKDQKNLVYLNSTLFYINWIFSLHAWLIFMSPHAIENLYFFCWLENLYFL